MLLSRLAQGVASAFWKTPRYRSCSRHRPNLARYQHRAPPAAFPQHRVDGGGGRRCLGGVWVVCGRYIHCGAQARRTAGRERRDIVPHILDDTETFHRMYNHATPLI